MYPFFYVFSGWTIAFLRVVIGALFSAHGWPKTKDLKTTAGNFEAMGFKPGIFWGPLVAFLEFLGGIALILGLYAQIFAGLFVGEFAVIVIWKLIRKQTFVSGWELDILILAASLILLTEGAGMFSLDRFLFGIF